MRIKPEILYEKRRAEGVKGMHPLGCLPLWETEGVTLITFQK
jgi:hypothetical protein